MTCVIDIESEQVFRWGWNWNGLIAAFRVYYDVRRDDDEGTIHPGRAFISGAAEDADGNEVKLTYTDREKMERAFSLWFEHDCPDAEDMKNDMLAGEVITDED